MRTLLSLTLAALLTGTAAGAQAAASFTVAAQYEGPDGGWDYASFDPVLRRVYLSRSDGVLALDVDTGKVTPRLMVAQRTHAVVPINNGTEVLVTSTAAGAAIIASASTGVIRATIPTGAKPDAAFLEPSSGLVWVMDNAGGGVSLIDPKTAAKEGSIAVEGALESAALDGQGRVFVNVEDRSEIAVLDIKARAVVGHYPLADCEEPSGLAYGEGRLVAACANRVAKVVNAQDGKVIATLAIGPRPDTALYDPARKLVYLPTGGDGVLTLISPSEAKVVGTAVTRTGARSLALDAKTGALYLPSAEFTPPAQPGGRPTAVPGTFRVLKLMSN